MSQFIKAPKVIAIKAGAVLALAVLFAASISCEAQSWVLTGSSAGTNCTLTTSGSLQGVGTKEWNDSATASCDVSTSGQTAQISVSAETSDWSAVVPGTPQGASDGENDQSSATASASASWSYSGPGGAPAVTITYAVDISGNLEAEGIDNIPEPNGNDCEVSMWIGAGGAQVIAHPQPRTYGEASVSLAGGSTNYVGGGGLTYNSAQTTITSNSQSSDQYPWDWAVSFTISYSYQYHMGAGASSFTLTSGIVVSSYSNAYLLCSNGYDNGVSGYGHAKAFGTFTDSFQ